MLFWNALAFSVIQRKLAIWSLAKATENFRQREFSPKRHKNFPQLWSTVKGFHIVVNEAEVDAFLECSCFFCYPTEVGNLISGSSAFSKSILYIWNFLFHILLRPSLKDFEHYLSSIWNEHNCMIEHSLALPFFRIEMKTDLFKSCWPLLSFPNFLAYWAKHFNSIIF